jgi:hypothetical protein
VSCEIKLYSGLEVTKARGEGGSSLTYFIAEATSPVRSEIKELRTEAVLSAHSKQKAFVVFPPKDLLHIVFSAD